MNGLHHKIKVIKQQDVKKGLKVALIEEILPKQDRLVRSVSSCETRNASAMHRSEWTPYRICRMWSFITKTVKKTKTIVSVPVWTGWWWSSWWEKHFMPHAGFKMAFHLNEEVGAKWHPHLWTSLDCSECDVMHALPRCACFMHSLWSNELIMILIVIMIIMIRMNQVFSSVPLFLVL